ncbi:hypothetical protein SUGI_0148390 [Cryptomeria japonica]|uniref:uncharacterized protein LOC131065245 n=1 Tax=Cryptomeria japonica TaxID=3369 RepID=UPI002408EB3E|nr:uncharacterized protein LOC131065245 [Cryptomeria japonica]GLJ11242.1 hypothetical protein SUGI_0148390 [Cryptomeria japonica]
MEGEGDGAAMAAEGLGNECREKTGGGVSGNDLSNTSSTIDVSASISLCRTSAASSPATKSHHAGHASEKPVVLKRLVPEMEAKSSSPVSVAGFTGKLKLLNGEMVEDKKPASECSMCGDVGFVRDLLLCKRCGYRLQHTYCSKLYPDVDMESWACEWCLFEEESNGAVKAKLGKRKMESRNKAFEFLLQIAQESPSSSSSSERQRYRAEGHGIATRKENGFKCGAVKVGKAEPRLVQTPRFIKEENILKLGHLYQDWKEDSAMKNGGQVPKKQRCNNSHPPSDKNNKALDKWRNLAKSKLHCSNTSKAIVRRYKLLADVLC